MIFYEDTGLKENRKHLTPPPLRGSDEGFVRHRRIADDEHSYRFVSYQSKKQQYEKEKKDQDGRSLSSLHNSVRIHEGWRE
jgi:hypothetical protein